MAATIRSEFTDPRVRDNRTALEYLKKSVEVGDSGPDCNTDENKANSFINIASVYSSAGKHDVALDFCIKAEALLTDLISDRKTSKSADLD